MTKKNKAATQIRIDEELFDELKEIAEKEMRTLNSQIEFFLAQSVSNYRRLQQASLENSSN